jgi:nicotinamide-nucleotide amidase
MDLQKQVNNEIEKVMPLIKEYVYGFDDETIESLVGKLLKEKKQTIAIAESCTGGYLSHLITTIPGSSDYFIGSVIAYANEIKFNELEVDKNILEKNGAVSEPIVKAMAEGVRKKFKTDFALATSGIAGPAGGSEDKPVGTVWIALAADSGTVAKKYLLGTNRNRTIQVASDTALNMLRKKLTVQE